MSVTRYALLSVLYASTLASAAAGQAVSRSPVSLGITAGRSMPAGFTKEFYDSGYQLAGITELRTPASWVAVRFSGGYQWLGSSTSEIRNQDGSPIGDMRVSTGLLSATAGLVLRVPSLNTAIRPYAL